MKSAYELALERLEQQGIGRPREDSLSETTREQMAEARSKAEAKLAELEILHRDRLARETDPVEHRKAEQQYLRDRQRIEEDRDRKIDKLRGD